MNIPPPTHPPRPLDGISRPSAELRAIRPPRPPRCSVAFQPFTCSPWHQHFLLAVYLFPPFICFSLCPSFRWSRGSFLLHLQPTGRQVRTLPGGRPSKLLSLGGQPRASVRHRLFSTRSDVKCFGCVCVCAAAASSRSLRVIRRDTCSPSDTRHLPAPTLAVHFCFFGKIGKLYFLVFSEP